MYIDIWESKPMNIYVLNALAFKVFGADYSSIWTVQIINGIFSVFLVYWLISIWTNDKQWALLGTLFFTWLYYFSGLYYSGNCTEEYAMTCMLLGLYGLSRYFRGSRPNLMITAGIGFSMAFWFKEPYLFSLLPWMLFGFIALTRKKEWKSLLRFIAGLAAPFILYLIYFLITGTLDEVYKTFVYNREYTAFMEMSFSEKLQQGWTYFIEYFQYGSVIVPFLPLLFAPAIFFARNDKIHRKFITLLLAQAILELFAISLSGLAVTHYYLQIIPTIVLLATYCIWLMSRELTFRLHLIAKGLVLGVVLNALFNVNLPESPRQERYTEVVNHLKTKSEDGDRLFVENAWHGSLYVQCNMLSDAFIPTPLFHYFMIQDKYNHERVNRFVQSLKSQPPRFIVVSEERGILQNHEELRSWFYMLYEKKKKFEIPRDKLVVYELSLP